MEYIKIVQEDIEYNLNICKDISYTVWVDTDGLFDKLNNPLIENVDTTFNKN